MTVYVDNMQLPAMVRGIRARWSHLLADTDDELMVFALKIGLKPQWAQNLGTWEAHYDVTDSIRTKAIVAGAIPIDCTGPEMLALLERKMCPKA